MRRLSILLYAAALLAPIRAGAAVHCVGTVDELRTALNAAAASPEGDEIRVRAGAYAVTQRLIYNSQNTGWLSLLGGYHTVSGDPCGGRTLSAFATVLDGGGGSAVLGIYYNPVAAQGSAVRLGVDNLSIINGTGTGFQRGGGLDIASYGQQFAELWLDNLYLGNNSGYFSGGINASVNKGLVRLANSLFDENRAPDSAFAHIAIGVPATEASHGVIVANNTFVNGSCAGSGGRGCGVGIVVCGGVAAQVSNNVFANNQTSDLNLEGCPVTGLGFGSVAMSHNTVATLSGNLAPGIGVAFAGDPGFVSTLNHDFRLRNDSPLRNQGLGPIPLYGYNPYDIDGGLRLRSGALDVGAFENADAMFGNGFE